MRGHLQGLLGTIALTYGCSGGTGGDSGGNTTAASPPSREQLEARADAWCRWDHNAVEAVPVAPPPKPARVSPPDLEAAEETYRVVLSNEHVWVDRANRDWPDGGSPLEGADTLFDAIIEGAAMLEELRLSRLELHPGTEPVSRVEWLVEANVPADLVVYGLYLAAMEIPNTEHVLLVDDPSIARPEPLSRTALSAYEQDLTALDPEARRARVREDLLGLRKACPRLGELAGASFAQKDPRSICRAFAAPAAVMLAKGCGGANPDRALAILHAAHVRPNTREYARLPIEIAWTGELQVVEAGRTWADLVQSIEGPEVRWRIGDPTGVLPHQLHAYAARSCKEERRHGGCHLLCEAGELWACERSADAWDGDEPEVVAGRDARRGTWARACERHGSAGACQLLGAIDGETTDAGKAWKAKAQAAYDALCFAPDDEKRYPSETYRELRYLACQSAWGLQTDPEALASSKQKYFEQACRFGDRGFYDLDCPKRSRPLQAQ